jgi:hypothetical protein
MTGAAEPSGGRLFARYAYSPNELGYCGPAQSGRLFDLAVTGRSEVPAASLAQAFTGAWPYLCLLAELSGIADPLDERVVRAYWIGTPMLDTVDRRAFGARLLATIGPQAGAYWSHLTPELIAEAMPTHGFHVLGVYPWSRLLAGGAHDQPLRVLDNCRIRWGTVLRCDDARVEVRSQPLSWDGSELALGPERTEWVPFAVEGVSFVDAPRPGDLLAIHWDWVCDRLGPDDVAALHRWTQWQIQATNRRLAAGRIQP